MENHVSRNTFRQLVDLEKIRQLLEAHFRITGMLSAILDADENILVAVGWQDICSRFHRANPASSARCSESDAYIKAHLHDFKGEYLEYRCRNGLRDVAVPIIIGGEHLATFFTGQFFYEDDKPDLEFFRAQAREFGFDEADYLDALSRVRVFSRDQVRSFMEYSRCLVEMIAEMGLRNLELSREVAVRKRAEKKLHDSMDYLEKIIDSVADPIFVKDREHRLLLVNAAECELAGRSREALIGRTDYDFFPKEEVDVFWEKDEIVFKTGRGNVNEEEITDAQGDKRIIVTKKTLYSDKSGAAYIVGVIRDITDLKRAEAEVRELNVELEQRVHERTSQLVVANEWLQREIAERKVAEEELRQKKLQLEELNHTLRQRVKKEVAKNREKDIILIQQNRQAALGETLEHIVHQWKQPLNTIGLLIQFLQSSCEKGKLTDDLVRETVDKTMQLLDHMSQTAEVFRDYYKPEKEKNVFGIRETVAEALSFIEPEFRHRNIAVEIDADQGLAGYGYPKEYAQVLLIILTNARDAFRERGTDKPRLAIKAFAEGKRAVVELTDNAGGIPEKAIGKLFDLYFTTKEAAGGTGIGLYMAKSIIEKHMKGGLSARNVNGGARFRIEVGIPRHGSGH
jgi:PAS domain S-box-containing protein